MRFYFSFSTLWSCFFQETLLESCLRHPDSFLIFNCEEVHVLPQGMEKNPTLVPYEAVWKNRKYGNHRLTHKDGSPEPIDRLEPEVREKWLAFYSILLQKKGEKKLICGIQNWPEKQTRRLQAVGEEKGWRNAWAQDQGALLIRLWSEKGHLCFRGDQVFDPVRERAWGAYLDGKGPDPTEAS